MTAIRHNFKMKINAYFMAAIFPQFLCFFLSIPPHRERNNFQQFSQLQKLT